MIFFFDFLFLLELSLLNFIYFLFFYLPKTEISTLYFFSPSQLYFFYFFWLIVLCRVKISFRNWTMQCDDLSNLKSYNLFSSFLLSLDYSLKIYFIFYVYLTSFFVISAHSLNYCDCTARPNKLNWMKKYEKISFW